MISTGKLDKLHLKCELINIDGLYPTRHKEIYQITDKELSINVMLDMFKLSYQATSNKNNENLNEKDVESYMDGNVYSEPLFSRNFVLVSFPFIDEKDNSVNTRFFRYSSDISGKDIQAELKSQCDVLDKEKLTFNEALFTLYGFNYVLTPDYAIKDSKHPIDKALINTKQGGMLQGFFADDEYKPTKEFITFAKDNHFLQLISGTKAETAAKREERNNNIVNLWKEESPLIGDKSDSRYETRGDVYEFIKRKLKINITLSQIGKIIRIYTD